jgi:hypothetical protein
VSSKPARDLASKEERKKRKEGKKEERKREGGREGRKERKKEKERIRKILKHLWGKSQGRGWVCGYLDFSVCSSAVHCEYKVVPSLSLS